MSQIDLTTIASKNISSFDWNTFKYLLESEGTGAGRYTLGFLVELGTKLAYLIGIIALLYTLIKIITAQQVNVSSVIIRVTIAIALITYYEPMCIALINAFDNVALTIDEATTLDVVKSLDKAIEDRESTNQEILEKIIEGNISEKEREKLLKSAGYYDPYKIDIWHFNIVRAAATLILFLTKIVIALVNKFRDIIIAFLLLIGRILIVGVVWEKTEGYAKGWFLSLINALSWTVLVAAINNLQQSTGFEKVFDVDATYNDMIDGLANCLVFLFMYLQVFNFSKELMAGSLGSAAASIGTSVATGLAAKYGAKGIMQGAKAIYNRKGAFSLGRLMKWAENIDTAEPVKIQDTYPALTGSQPLQLEGNSYQALPGSSNTPQIGEDDYYALPDFSQSAQNQGQALPEVYDIYDGGPVIDVDYTVND